MLRVLSFNLLAARYCVPGPNATPAEAERLRMRYKHVADQGSLQWTVREAQLVQIRDAAADVVCLQEVEWARWDETTRALLERDFHVCEQKHRVRDKMGLALLVARSSLWELMPDLDVGHSRWVLATLLPRRCDDGGERETLEGTCAEGDARAGYGVVACNVHLTARSDSAQHLKEMASGVEHWVAAGSRCGRAAPGSSCFQGPTGSSGHNRHLQPTMTRRRQPPPPPALQMSSAGAVAVRSVRRLPLGARRRYQ